MNTATSTVIYPQRADRKGRHTVFQLGKRVQAPGMREQVIEASATLGLTPPFEAINLLSKIAGARDCVIEVEPHPMIGYALWGAVSPFLDGRVFFIYYKRDAPKMLRELIIYHELAHIWLGHVRLESERVFCGGTLIALTTPQQERDADEWARHMMAHAQIVTGRELAERLVVTGTQRFSRYGKMLSHFEV